MTNNKKRRQALNFTIAVSVVVYCFALYLLRTKKLDIASIFATLSTTLFTFAIFRDFTPKKVDTLYNIAMSGLAIGLALIFFASSNTDVAFLGATICGGACSVLGYTLDVHFDEVDKRKDNEPSKEPQKATHIVTVRKKHKEATDINIRIEIR